MDKADPDFPRPAGFWWFGCSSVEQGIRFPTTPLSTALAEGVLCDERGPTPLAHKHEEELIKEKATEDVYAYYDPKTKRFIAFYS